MRDGPRQPKVSVCVPTYKAHAEPNLATLGAQMAAALDGLTGELVVALNGISARRARVPAGAVVVDLGVNRGVPGAWNAAAGRARGTHLVFCNDDVALGAGSLRVLVEALEGDPEAGVAGPVGTMWDIPAGRHRSYLPSDRGLTVGQTRACDVVSGFLFATPRGTYDAAGGFDEAYGPAGFEEVDYCTMVRLELHQRCLAVAGVAHEHEFGVSARRHWRRISWSGGRESIASIAARNHSHFVDKWRSATSASENATESRVGLGDEFKPADAKAE